jgi:hypothetical protein
VEIIQAGEPARSGLYGVSGLAEDLADVVDALVDRFGPDAEQGGDGDTIPTTALRAGLDWPPPRPSEPGNRRDWLQSRGSGSGPPTGS